MNRRACLDHSRSDAIGPGSLRVLKNWYSVMIIVDVFSLCGASVSDNSRNLAGKATELKFKFLGWRVFLQPAFRATPVGTAKAVYRASEAQHCTRVFLLYPGSGVSGSP